MIMKKGDTLIEVTLAVGIFSMVAISVVAVMVSGTSNTQTALETTLAREEIDTQAEALRFIHSAYLADEGSEDPYTKLWEEITNHAYTPNKSATDALVQQYNPTSCQEIFDPTSGLLKSNLSNYAFIINPRGFSDLKSTNIGSTYLLYRDNVNTFRQTTTYPRLVFNQQNSATDTIISENEGNRIRYAEGIYVIAVKDPKSTTVIGTGGKSSAYYDFYIRTCWYGTGSDAPTTISTVIRLYDPKGITR